MDSCSVQAKTRVLPIKKRKLSAVDFQPDMAPQHRTVSSSAATRCPEVCVTERRSEAKKERRLPSDLSDTSSSEKSRCDKRQRTMAPLKSLADRILSPIASHDLEFSYALEEEIGWGHFGTVRSCVHRSTGERFACKIISKESITDLSDARGMRSEVEILLKVASHENIVSLKEVFEDNEAIYLIQELMMGGELFHSIQSHHYFGEALARCIFQDIVTAVAFCHSEAGVMHRDLKPENILLEWQDREGEAFPRVKLADFGLSIFLRPGERTRGICGSAFYMAPEVLTDDSCKGYGHAADMWSLGVILFVLLSGTMPFWGSDDDDTYEEIKKKAVDFSAAPWADVSQDAKDLVKRLLSKDASRRPSACALLCSPWMCTVTVEDEYERSASERACEATDAETTSCVDNHKQTPECSSVYGEVGRECVVGMGESEYERSGIMTSSACRGQPEGVVSVAHSSVLEGEEREEGQVGEGGSGMENDRERRCHSQMFPILSSRRRKSPMDFSESSFGKRQMAAPPFWQPPGGRIPVFEEVEIC